MAVQFGNIFFGKVFDQEQGATLAAEVNSASPVSGRRVVIIDHPPTQGLVPLIRALEGEGAEVYLRDHHADGDRDRAIVSRCREILGDRAVVTTRVEHPACSTLVAVGEFCDDIIIADVIRAV